MLESISVLPWVWGWGMQVWTHTWCHAALAIIARAGERAGGAEPGEDQNYPSQAHPMGADPSGRCSGCPPAPQAPGTSPTL